MKINNIYTGDCLQVMKTLEDESINCIFTDPPYNENYDYADNYVDNRVDYYEFLEQIIIQSKRVLKDSGSLYLKHSSRQINKIMPMLSSHLIFQNLIIWISNSQAHPNKNYDSYYEPLYFYTKTQNFTFNKRAEYRAKPKDYWSGEGKEFIGLLVNVWYDIPKDQAGCLKSEIDKINNEKIHPCSMPIRLPERAINISTNENDIVFDPFMGSGTTALACELLNRRWGGCEISPKYVAIANERIEREKAQLKLF